MNVSLDVLIKEMVRNEVRHQLCDELCRLREEGLIPSITELNAKIPDPDAKMLTKIDGEEVVNPVDTSAADQVQADKDAKLAKRRANAAAKKAKEEADAKAAAEAEADDDSELDEDMCSEDESTELSAVDLLAGVNKAIKSSSLPKAQAKSMAKEVLAEDFGFDKFGEVTADKRAEVLSKVADALK